MTLSSITVLSHSCSCRFSNSVLNHLSLYIRPCKCCQRGKATRNSSCSDPVVNLRQVCPPFPRASQVQLLPEEEVFVHQEEDVSLTPWTRGKPAGITIPFWSVWNDISSGRQMLCYDGLRVPSIFRKSLKFVDAPHVWDETKTTFTDAKGEQILQQSCPWGDIEDI